MEQGSLSKLKEEINVFADEGQKEPRLQIAARKWGDFNGVYDIKDATTGEDPKLPEDMFKVVRSIKDRSLKRAFRRAIRDEVLTYKEVRRLINSTKDFKLTTEQERRELLMILARVTSLDEKSQTVARSC